MLRASKNKRIKIDLKFKAYILLVIALFSTSLTAYSANDSGSLQVSLDVSSTEDPAKVLREKIDKKNQDIASLEKEIASYQNQIQDTASQGQTLKGKINTLALTRKKLLADIKVTENKIDATSLTIESLTDQIGDKQKSIAIQQQGLEATIRKTNETDDVSVFEAMLQNESLSSFWRNQSELISLHGSMNDKIKTLLSVKQDLSNTKDQTVKQQNKLLNLRYQLADQKKIVEQNQAETSQLLKETQEKESNYKQLLIDRQAKYTAAQQELLNYESQLKLVINPGSYPAPNKILSPPLDQMVVTQPFGDTDFARTHAGVYNGHGHNGVDFKASPGTPIKAALSGTVIGTGDTDIVCPASSYGRWVLIKHSNGLTTLYAHLSLIKAFQGQQVGTGDLIGYSGSTGYATGPHLHFTLFVSQGVQVATLKSKVCRGSYTLPVADLRAYLNPMLYL